MRTVFIAENLFDAELLRQRLVHEGFEAVVHHDHLQGALGELPLSCRPEVRVLRNEDFEAARRVVNEVEERRRAPEGPELKCKDCGELSPNGFELCWSCRAPLVAVSERA